MVSSFTSHLETALKLKFVVFSDPPLTEAASEADNIIIFESEHSDKRKSGLGDKAVIGDTLSRIKAEEF